jgi:UDP-N-acetylglucosamine 3-dehydrogenase
MKISICGLGVMGKNHLRVCNKNNHTINSIYDPLNKDDYQEFILSLKNSDALIVASPTNCHIKNMIDALEINNKLKILCEKPISSNSNDYFLEYLKPYDENILVGQIERFNPVVQKLKSKIFCENIIQIKTIRVNNIPSREPIDVRKDIGIHDLDICCQIAGVNPEKINILSAGYPNKNHENLFYKINDIQITNEVSWRYPYKDRRISVLCESGLYEAHYFNQTLNFIDWSNNKINIDIERSEPLEEEIRFLEKMVKNNISSCSTPTENIKLLKLLGY